MCGKLYCFFGKTMTWHLIIGYIRWQKTWLLRHDRIQFTLYVYIQTKAKPKSPESQTIFAE